MTNEALASLDGDYEAVSIDIACPSIAPERLIYGAMRGFARGDKPKERQDASGHNGGILIKVGVSDDKT